MKDDFILSLMAFVDFWSTLSYSCLKIRAVRRVRSGVMSRNVS